MAHAIANESIYATAEFVGYSLWLVPDASVAQTFTDVINEFAVRLDTPPFLPHATLLGGVVGLETEQAAKKAKEVADGLHAMDAEVKVVTSKDLLYFQCVFALLDLFPELEEAHKHAMKVFGRKDEPPLLPHISLIYGDLESEERKTLARELGPRLDGTRMKIERLQLWNTTGPVKNWRMVAEFTLLSSSV